MRLLSPGNFSTPGVVAQYLLPHEQLIITLRRHPAIMLDAFIVTGIGILGSSLLSADVIPGGSATTLSIAWAVSFIWLLYLIARLAIWRVTFMVVTAVRVMFVGGLRGKKVTVIPLSQIWDLSLRRSYLGLALGYGMFTVEFAPGYGMRKIHFMPYPEQLYLELVDIIIPAGDEFDEPGPADPL